MLLFFFTLKLLYTFLIPISKGVFFSPNDLKQEGSPESGPKENIDNIKTTPLSNSPNKVKKDRVRFRYLLHIYIFYRACLIKTR